MLGDRALMVTELVPKSGFYDFDAKYTDGMTEHVCPAQIPDEIDRSCASTTRCEAHRLLGCRGTSRSDFRWDDEQGEDGLFLLETNTQPGMTPLSLVPEQARHLRHRLRRAGRDRSSRTRWRTSASSPKAGAADGADDPPQRQAGAPPGAARRAPARKVRKAQARTNSLIDALMRVLPFTEEQLHKAFLVLILAGAAALAWLVASLAGVTALAGQQLAFAAADAGYEVRRVEVRGVERMNELKVYERVLGEKRPGDAAGRSRTRCAAR